MLVPPAELCGSVGENLTSWQHFFALFPQMKQQTCSRLCSSGHGCLKLTSSSIRKRLSLLLNATKCLRKYALCKPYVTICYTPNYVEKDLHSCGEWALPGCCWFNSIFHPKKQYIWSCLEGFLKRIPRTIWRQKKLTLLKSVLYSVYN